MMFVLVATGCGRLGFDATSEPAPVGEADDLEPPLIDPSLPFDPVSPIAELASSAADDDPSATGDLLELYFSSKRPGGAGADDIWVATRDAADQPFARLEPVAVLNTSLIESAPEVTRDGLVMYFARGMTRDLFVATRASRADAWRAPVPIAEINTDDSESSPSTDASMLRLVFHSNRSDTGADLWEATRVTRAGAWGPPRAIAQLNTVVNDQAPHLDPSGLIIYWASRITGDFDIYRAARPSLDQPFGPAEPVNELDSDDNDTDVWLSPDGRTILFSSDRSGNSEIYWATR